MLNGLNTVKHVQETYVEWSKYCKACLEDLFLNGLNTVKHVQKTYVEWSKYCKACLGDLC